MKPNYLWCLFIILLNQENTIDGSAEPPDEVRCYETDVNRSCFQRKEIMNKPNQLLFKCISDTPEKARSCGAKMRNKCGKVEVFFKDGDKVTITGCDKKNKSKSDGSGVCKEWGSYSQIQHYEILFTKSYLKKKCTWCEEDYCNSKNPVTTTKTPVTSPKKEENSENSGVSPNMASLMLLVLLIFSF